MDNIINLKDVKEYMYGYNIVTRIYEIRDDFYFANGDDKIEYNELIVSFKILDYIREINFVFSPGVGILEDIKEIRKVGNLLNFQVYLDPNYGDSIMMIKEGKPPIYIQVLF